MSAAVRVSGEAVEVARAESLAVLGMVQDGERRERLADLVAALDEGEVAGPEADALAELIELGLASGRIRSLYGPGGEQAALTLFRRLPPGRDLAESAKELNEALCALEGRTIEGLTVSAVGPGEYGVTIATDQVEFVLRLGRAGARLATIGA